MNEFHRHHVPDAVHRVPSGFEFDGMVSLIIEDDVDHSPRLTLKFDQQTDLDHVDHDLTPLDGLPVF